VKPLYPTWPFTLAGFLAFGALAIDGIIRKDVRDAVVACGGLVLAGRLLIRGL
jgi:hypothetical protein